MKEILQRQGVAKNGNISIAYEVFEPKSRQGQPLLLIMGTGMQMLMWNEDFCRALVEAGFRVARFDNRDVGRSTHLPQLGEPNVLAMFFQPQSTAVYTVEDMADDAVAVLDALGWKAAHIVGGSLGGVVAQALALAHPERVLSLTSMMSTPTGKLGMDIVTAMRVSKLSRRPLRDAAEAGQQMVDMFRIIGSPGYPMDEQWLRQVGAASYERGYDPAGKLRQQAALFASGDRRQRLKSLRMPVLVLHGEADKVFRPMAAKATADAIPGSRLVLLPGMGHGAIPRQLWPTIINEIGSLAGRLIKR